MRTRLFSMHVLRGAPNGVQMEYKTCTVCGAGLTGRKSRFCSDDCIKKFKRQQMRLKRPPRDHICQCKTCGREMRVGRPQVGDKDAVANFVRPSPSLVKSTPELQPR